MRIALALFALTFLPGIPLAAVFFRTVQNAIAWLSLAGVLGMVWSTGLTLLLTLLHTPLTPLTIVGAAVLPTILVVAWPTLRLSVLHTLKQLVLPSVATWLVVLTMAAVALPFLTVQGGLPTGDVQKAIVWGTSILDTTRLPTYGDALALNRDPADFATPGLHAVTAAVMRLSGDPLRGPAWFGLLGGLLLAGLAAALGNLLGPVRLSLLPPLAFLLAAANARALRYTAAPGYHYQNLLGELVLVLAFIALLDAVGDRGHRRSLFPAIVAVALLPFVHQFSTFLAVLVLPVLCAFLLLKYRREITALLMRRFGQYRYTFGAVLLVVATAGAWLLLRSPLFIDGVSRLVTSTPHLRGSLIPPQNIPELLGVSFVLLGAAGMVIAIVRMRRREIEWRWGPLILWIALLITVSQGPRWFLDIPSARTLFYAVTPLAVVAALALASVLERIRALWPRAAPVLAPGVLALALAPTVGVPLNASLQGFDRPTSGTAVLTNHRHPRNATLTPQTQDFLSFLTANPPSCPAGEPRTCADGIVVDDWGRRRSTWAILSPYRMLTRVGADIHVSAQEAHQSRQRQRQYEALLDFEKVFSLATSPAIAPLLDRHGIAFIAGASGTSAEGFRQNPILEPVFENAEITVFRRKTGSLPSDTDATFLLAPTTLVNDLGDAEDSAEHLPLPLFAPSSSDPLVRSGRTVRDLRALESLITINAGRFVPHLWNANNDGSADRPVRLLLRALANGARGQLRIGTLELVSFALPNTGRWETIRLEIPTSQIRLDRDGALTVTLATSDGLLRLDLLAAGLAQ